MSNTKCENAKIYFLKANVNALYADSNTTFSIPIFLSGLLQAFSLYIPLCLNRNWKMKILKEVRPMR